MRERARTMTLRPSGYRLAIVAAIVGLVVIGVANAFGLWWVTMLFGFLIGLLVRGALPGVIVAGLPAVLGWGLPLAWQSLFVPIGRVADVVGGILGFGAGSGGATIIATLILALLLSLSGLWLGSALRRLIVPTATIAEP